MAGSVPFQSVGQHSNGFGEDDSFELVDDFSSNTMEAPCAQAMEVDNRAVSEVAAEGKSSVRSCTTCSKAKAKCVKRPDQQICERYVG